MIHRIYSHYTNPDESRINEKLANREFEKPIEGYVLDCFESIQDVIDTIKLVESSFTIDVDKVDVGSYDRTRSKKAKDKKQKYIRIDESRVGELTMKFHVSDVFEDQKIELDYTVRELIPIPDENGIILLKGVKYTPQYQLTETSTYVTSSNLVMKSLLPIRVKRVPVEIRTDAGKFYNVRAFHAYMLDDFENIFLYYFAKFGVLDTLEYFNIGSFITVLPVSEIEENGKLPQALYFKPNGHVVIEVNKEAFFVSEYLRNITGTVWETITPSTTYEDMLDLDFWVNRIGGTKKDAKKEAHYELGKRYQTLFNRMLDRSSRENLRTTWHSKESIYNIIRWICQHYDRLRKKDNLNILNKRLRCNQYIGFGVNIIISDKIKKFVNTTTTTKDALINKYKNFFTFRGNEVITKIHSSGLMKNDNNLVNDLNFFQKLKITIKGANSLGNKNSRNIAASQRALHPSHIGILGLDTCSSSDPGITNYINPLCETDGLFFKGAPPEPEDFYYGFLCEVGVITDDEDDVITIDPIKFNNALEIVDGISIKPINEK